MFVDFSEGGPPPPPWRPDPAKRRLTPRQESTMAWILGFNLLVLFVAPIAGVTLFDALLSIFGG